MRHTGPSEVGVETTRRALNVPPVTDLQTEYFMLTRGPEAVIFRAPAPLGISHTLYSVLSHGLLTAGKVAGRVDNGSRLPCFSGSAHKQNAAAVARLRWMLESNKVRILTQIG